MVKITGSEWNRFYEDPEAWPDGSWHEDEEITMNGNATPENFDLSVVPNAAMLVVTGGVVYLKDREKGLSLETYFKKWRKQQTTTVLVVEVAHEAVKAVHAAITAAGGKVRT